MINSVLGELYPNRDIYPPKERVMTYWISTKEENPKPNGDRCFLITDGNSVTLGVFEDLGKAEWIDIEDQKCSSYYFRGNLGKITHWASVPLPPQEENEN